MITPLARAHIVAQERLRAIVTAGVAAAWAGLPGYDDGNLGEWLSGVLPLIAAAQRQSVSLTEAFLARALGRAALGVDPATLTGAAVRAGAAPEDVYRRPFVTVWTALKAGTAYDQAVAAGLARATGTATMDVQLAHRATLQAVQDRDPMIRGYERVPDAGACSYCQALAGAFVKSADAAPLHNGCGCGFEPVLSEQPATPPPESVAVNAHGELGPVLGSANHVFTTDAELG